jgi:hypothetical protein
MALETPTPILFLDNLQSARSGRPTVRTCSVDCRPPFLKSKQLDTMGKLSTKLGTPWGKGHDFA